MWMAEYNCQCRDEWLFVDIKERGLSWANDSQCPEGAVLQLNRQVAVRTFNSMAPDQSCLASQEIPPLDITLR